MPIYTPITVAYGDGIGPEIMTATLKILMPPTPLLILKSLMWEKKFI